MTEKKLKFNSCSVCGEDISHKRADCKVCEKKSCKNAILKTAYKTRKTEKICKMCQEKFFGTDKKLICETCEQLPRVVNHEYIEQPIICKFCNKIIGINNKVKSSKVLKVVYSSCTDCRKEKQSKDKIGANNPNWQGGITAKKKASCMSKQEVSEFLSQRMKKDNPMFSRTVQRKVSKTLRKRYSDGTIVSVKGSKHWHWRGNRKASFILRTRLKPWVRKVMERDNFTCQNCFKRGGRLEVHHAKTPFREIVKLVLAKNNVEQLSSLEVNSDLFEKITLEIYENHTLDMGITLCKKCHSLLDSKRKIKDEN